jgi:aromatic-L-amino-acid decarboxylase
MTPEEFRKHGHELIDWIARYMEHVEDYPVLSQVSPGEVRAKPPAGATCGGGEPFEAVLRDIDTIVMPGITHWQSPNFFGYFPANNSAPSILGELLAAGLGVNGMLWSTSPACTELETHVMDWLVDMLALPPEFKATAVSGGVHQDTASSASLCALLAARERATGGRGNVEGAGAGRLVAYTSSQAHSSIEKDVRIAGIGSDNLRLVDVDASYAMRPAHLRSSSPPTGPLDWSLPSFAPPWVRHPPLPSTLCARSGVSAVSTASGSTSTPRWPGLPPSARSCAS